MRALTESIGIDFSLRQNTIQQKKMRKAKTFGKLNCIPQQTEKLKVQTRKSLSFNPQKQPHIEFLIETKRKGNNFSIRQVMDNELCEHHDTYDHKNQWKCGLLRH